MVVIFSKCIQWLCVFNALYNVAPLNHCASFCVAMAFCADHTCKLSDTDHIPLNALYIRDTATPIVCSSQGVVIT